MMENSLPKPPRDNTRNTVSKKAYRKNEQKKLQWSIKSLRIKNYFEAKGHKFISCKDRIYHFDGLPPLNIHDLRIHYDRCVYNDRKNQLKNWSQQSEKDL